MKEFLATLTRHGKFKWELDLIGHKTGRKQTIERSPPPYLQEADLNEQGDFGRGGAMDPFGDIGGQQYTNDYQEVSYQRARQRGSTYQDSNISTTLFP